MTPVILSFPADPQHVAVARTTAATIAARADLTIDQVEDARLAIDEAVSQLILLSPDSTITCEFVVDAGELLMRVRSDAASAAAFDTGSFGWTVMSALVDALVDTTSSAGPGLDLRLRRREAVQA